MGLLHKMASKTSQNGVSDSQNGVKNTKKWQKMWFLKRRIFSLAEILLKN
ncbi:hypothetical protein [Helicobacter cinaedi]|nr:hypothetical protein [Helicobacter cinaedi]